MAGLRYFQKFLAVMMKVEAAAVFLPLVYREINF